MANLKHYAVHNRLKNRTLILLSEFGLDITTKYIQYTKSAEIKS